MTDKILYDSKEAAQQKTVTGWVSSTGQYWGDNEHMARWSGCTHLKCECGNEHSRSWTICETCREINRCEKFEALEKRVWDGEIPLCLDDGDEYFFDEESLIDYAEENEISISDLQLRICEPIAMQTIDESSLLDDLHEDAELPDKIASMVDALNKEIMSLGPQSWTPSKYAAIVNI